MVNDPLHKIEQVTEKTNKVIGERTQNTLKKYPVTFSLIVLFGVIAVLHGFERIIDEIAFLDENPFIIFLVGLAILIFTGSLYKKLNKELD